MTQLKLAVQSQEDEDTKTFKDLWNPANYIKQLNASTKNVTNVHPNPIRFPCTLHT